MSDNKINNTYDENSIKSLGIIGGVREKPSSIGLENYNHTFIEILANAIDEYREGYGKKIIVTKHKDKSISIQDFGRSVPMDKNSKGDYAYKKVFDELWSGGKYSNNKSDRNYLYSLGTNGCGVTGSNYTSDFFEITSFSPNGYKYYMKYEKGIQKIELQKEKHNLNYTGTIIHWIPSKKVFRGENDINIEFIQSILFQQSIVNKGLKFVLIDEINNNTFEYYYENGIIDYIKEISQNKNFIDIIQWNTETEGKDNNESDSYKIKAEIIFTFNNEINLMQYYHNSSFLENGGTPENFIKNAFTYSIDKYCKDNNLYQKSDKKISFDDIKDSLIIISNTFSTISLYTDQVKKKIESKFMQNYMTDYLKQQLEIYFVENKIEANKIANQCLINMRANEKANKAKLDIRKKLSEKSNFTDDIENFYPCNSEDKNIKELYLCEGASAQGSIIQGRDSEFQASFHVGGKMLSLLKADYLKIFKSTVVINLFKILKCGIEVKNKYNKDLNTFNEDNLDWNKIILATDQDTDAYQIRCLMLTCIYRLAPTLIKHGYVYIAESPLFEITDENEKIYFAYTEKEKNNIIKNLKDKKIKFNKPERNKGLGEVTAEVIDTTMMNISTRKITQITVSDAEKMAQEFELWLGDNIPPRRNTIINNFDYEEHFDDEKIKDITKVLKENYLPYAIEMIKERAIISIDGFKPAHRKLLWTLHEMGLYNNKRRKSANVVGDNMSYNVHGDGSIYDTLVRMAQKDTLNYPYVNGKGNFGQHTSKLLQNAHMRYTETGASEINKEFFKDIEKNAVDFIPNFDGEKQEPSLLPTIFPNLLVNANEGIAVGMASRTPSFNLKEVCDFTIEYLKNKNIKVSDYLLAPDFATGGQIIRNVKELDEIYSSGKGNISIRAKYNYNENSNTIIITEIPYTTNRETIVKEIKDLCRNNIIKTITNVKDTTDKKGLSITINIKKNTNVQKLMNQLFKLTKLEDKYSFNMNIICLDKIPRVLGIKKIIDEWIIFRIQCLKRIIEYDIKNKSETLHSLKGLEKVLLDIDKAINIIRYSKTDNKIIDELINSFNIDKIQANEIFNMRLRNINERYITEKIKSISKLENEINELQSTLSDDNKINNVIITDLEKIKTTYGQPRKTEIIYEDNIPQISTTELIENYNTVIQLTSEGYLKKIPAISMRGNTVDKLKDGDKIIYEKPSTNKSTILVFTSLGFCYKLYAHQINDTKTSLMGIYLPQELNLLTNEKIISIIDTGENYEGYIIEIFENGSIAKIPTKSFKTESKRSQLKNALSLKSKLIKMFIAEKDTDILLKSSLDKVLITNTSIISPKDSKNTQGNMIMKSKNDSVVVLAELLDNIDTDKIEDIEYYKNESGKGVGTYQKKIDEIVLK